jgi:hypothetical protein
MKRSKFDKIHWELNRERSEMAKKGELGRDVVEWERESVCGGGMLVSE